MKNIVATSLTFIIGFLYANNQPLFSQQPYFQQEVNYTISVSLNDESHYLSAFETIEYVNNSSDTLKFLYFHLWPNAYKNKNTAFAKQEVENGDNKFFYSSEEDKGFIDSLNFKVNGAVIKWEIDEENIDICKLYLGEPLISGDRITITTPFYVKIPGSFSRFGHVGQSYQITQWYPKPAVYDPEGWHPIPYLDQGEFYSEFGSFDVTITLPANYVVGATGELQTISEIEWLNKRAKSGNRSESYELNGFKTIRYTENNVHDFAWFADKEYLVKKDSVKLPNSGEWVTTWAMYPPKDSVKWGKANEYINDAIFYYSKWYGNYPYKNCSAVRGSIEAGGAMEYPGITVVGSAGNDLTLETMIMHEVGHNWFYGILGFNEREYPYLDEGFNSFSEFRYMNEKYRKQKKAFEIMVPEKIAKFTNSDDLPYSSFYEISSLMPQRNNTDQPMNTAAYEFTSLNYGSVGYHKSALVYYYLLNSLGEVKFDSIMQNFYKTWKFKHPQPDDFKEAFVLSAGKDLSWFFNDLESTTKRVDYKASHIRKNKILVKNKGDIASPVFITGYNGNSKEYSIQKDGFFSSKWIDLPDAEVDKIVINDIEIPEYNLKNNTIKTSGLLKKCEPLEIDKFQIFEKPGKTQLGLIPAMGWNTTDKFMLGLMFYNQVLPIPRLEYQLIPLYSFNGGIKLLGQINFHTFPDVLFIRQMDIKYSAYIFQNFEKERAELKFYLKKIDARSPINQNISLSLTGIFTIAEPSPYNYINHSYYDKFFNIKYTVENKNVLHPFTNIINAEWVNNKFRASTTFNIDIPTVYSKEAVSLRFFGSYIFKLESRFPVYLSGGSFADYENDLIFPARNEVYASESVFSYQYAANQGGFTSYNPFWSEKWLTTAQVKVKIPKIPFKVYGTIGSYYEAGDEFFISLEKIDTKNVAYEAGIEFAINNFLEVFFPIMVSSDIDKYLTGITDNYGQRIRFSMNLPLLNLFKLRDTLVE